MASNIEIADSDAILRPEFIRTPPSCAQTQANRRRNPNAQAALAIGLLLPMTGSAVDMSLTINPTIAQELNDNLFLTTQTATRKPLKVYGLGSDLGLVFQANAIEWSSRTSLNTVNRLYPGNESINRADQYLNFDITRRTELSQTGITVGIDQDSNQALLPEDNLGNLGLVEATTRFNHRGRRVGFNQSFTVSDRWNISMGYSYSSSEYDAPASLGYSSSEGHTGSFSSNYAWSEKLNLSCSLSQSNSDIFSRDRARLNLLNGGTTLSGTEIERTALLLGFQYELTDTINISFSAGPQFNTNRGTNLVTIRGGVPLYSIIESSSPSETLQAGATKRFENGSFSFGYSSSVNTNIRGQQVSFESYSFAANRQLSDKVKANISLVLNSQQQSAGINLLTSNQNQTDSLSILAGITWSLTPDWELQANYRYSQRTFIRNSDMAESNSLGVDLKYRVDPFQL